jgi:hypothetical protein
MRYLRENTTKYKQDMLGYFAKNNLNIKQLKLDIAQQSGNKMDLEQQKLIQTIEKSTLFVKSHIVNLNASK